MLIRICILAILLVLHSQCAGLAQSPTDRWEIEGQAYGRFVDQTSQWQGVGGDLISGFYNMYHLTIMREPGDDQYPYRGWFFGWATQSCNKSLGLQRGCDMIFAARAASLVGPWQIYAGNGQWDDGQTPKRWQPVLVAEDEIYNSWHNGDPSLVRHNGVLYMAYSATGFNQDRIPFGKPGDKDSDLNCIMGATSTDGLDWRVTRRPIMIEQRNIGQAPAKVGDFMPPFGAFHRPSLMREGNTWKLWFDAWDGRDMGMCYAENAGEFDDPQAWKVMRNVDQMSLSSFPNPDVIKIEDVYIAFADPTGYQPKFPTAGEQRKFLADWASRKICQAVSLNGVDWVPVGFIERDQDAQANQVPVAYVEQIEDGAVEKSYWLYLSYATQIFGDYRYDRIRLKRQKIGGAEIDKYRQLCRQVFGPK